MDARDALGGELSKGMRQKTLIAATVMGSAPVLLLDEPMIGLDPLGQRRVAFADRVARGRGNVDSHEYAPDRVRGGRSASA